METLQPKLRFPEFKGDWERKSLRDITSLVTKGTTPKFFTESGINFIKIECLNGHNIDTSKCLFIDETTHNKELKRSILKEDDLLFAIAGATIGKCTIVDKSILPANTNQALSIIRLNNNENKNYIFQILTSESMKKYIIDNISVGAQPNLNLEQINSFSFSYPTLPEQTRIANFLAAVDEKLNLLKEKKEALETYKKGIMQQIFNQGIRFKDENGNDFEDWVELKLEDVVNNISTGLNPRDNFKLGSGENFYVTIKNISNGKLKFNSCEKIDNTALKLINKRSGLQLNDIIMSSIGNVGESYLVSSEPFNWDINESVFCIRANDRINPQFLYYVVTNDETEQYFDGNITGSSFKSIKMKELKLTPIKLPSIEEQTKIANFLLAIDEKIELVSNQIQDTQAYKKGLLQQMFV